MSTEQEKQQKIDAWYQNFIQQISQPPYSVQPHRAEDKGRLYRWMDQPKMNGINEEFMEAPVKPGEDLYDKRNELYELAEQGKLYIFELGSQLDCSQVRTEPDNKLLYDLKNDVLREPTPPKPVEQKLSFFKSIFNALFGAFKAERLQLEEKYAQEMRQYNWHKSGVECEGPPSRSMSTARKNAIKDNQEVVRSYIPTILKNVNEELEKGKDLLSWQKDANEARAKMYSAFRDGTPLTREEREDILAKLIVFRMGEYKTKIEDKSAQANALQDLLHKQPEKAKEIETILKSSPNVQERVNKGDAFLVSCTFSPVNLDTAVKEALGSLITGNGQHQKQAENLKQLMKTTAEPQAQQQVQQGQPQSQPQLVPQPMGMGGSPM